MNITIVTQARVGSTRFPSKVLQPVGNTTMLGLHLSRLKQSKIASNIIVATTHEPGVEQIVRIAADAGIPAFQGSTDDVLDRFYQAVRAHKPNYVVRVTSDCPLIDAGLIDSVIKMTVDQDLDYGANILIEEFPDGQDVEVVKFTALDRAWKEAKLVSDREHVTPFIRNNTDFKNQTLFRAKHFPAPANYNKIRMTVDQPEDLDAIKKLVEALGTNSTWIEYTKFILNHPEQFTNQEIFRNEGYLKSLQKDF